MAYKTNAELEAGIKRWQDELDQADMERGYCLLDFEVSDYFAYEVYKRYRDEVTQYLLTYAGILIESKQPFKMDKTDKILNWIDCLDIAGHCPDISLSTDCTMMAYYLKVIVGVFDEETDPIYTPYLISSLVKDRFTPYWKEMGRLDYNDNYDEYLTEKKGLMEQWRNLH